MQEIVEALLQHMPGWKVILAEEALLPEAIIAERFTKQLTEDPVFGQMSETTLADFFDRDALARLWRDASAPGQTIVIGTGATLVCPDPTLLVYADMARAGSCKGGNGETSSQTLA